MQDSDYDDLYGSNTDKGPAISAGVIVIAAILLLTGIAISFSGSVQF